NQKSIHAWRGSAVSTKVDTHQEQQEPVEGGVGPVAGVSAAWMPRSSPKDGFTASPQPGTAPPNKQKSQSRFGSGFCCGT
ncbi:hypothetical protein, partial [Stenotrophomonas sp. RAC2]|uniref:hypothetical protein n=1 Tax=Stenotrophomonas sp. RAC2 TaxID=3064902 RepID=UPI0027177D0B